MQGESRSTINIPGRNEQVLRYAKIHASEKATDIGYSVVVGDKSIRIYANNKVEIWDLEYIREDDWDTDADEQGLQEISYSERLSWATDYPEWLSLANVKASIDFAFMSAGMSSIFYRTNLFIMNFDNIEDHRLASKMAFEILYPEAEPVLTEMNFTLMRLGQDLFLSNRMDS